MLAHSVLKNYCGAAFVLRKMSSHASELLVSSSGPTRTITLNRPKALNALNLNMVREIYPLLQEWNLSNDVNLIMIKGSGDKAFCAGGDVLAVTKSAKDAQAGKDSTMHQEFFKEEYQLNHLIGTLSKPYVALIDGIVMGGGCGLSINGRYRVATEKTKLAMPETALGLFPDVGGSYFLSRLRNNLGMFLALTGYRLEGADTFHAGLTTHYIESSQLPALEKALSEFKQVDDETVKRTLASFGSKQLPPFSLEKQLRQIRETFGGKSVEEIIENLNKDGSEWATTQIKILKKMSPTSLKVTHRQLETGKRMSFSKIFSMEYRLSQRFMDGHDFHEGCRAILIDKDRNPKWKPATLEEVDDDSVDKYFAPLPHTQELLLHDEE
ncbi:unnamed protein product, partial [Mesorhabditis belari]|uniref:3-hydroxyisobutyryl-CoA hydrolase, mitochondrial n=1 Tax=Mesorhabditis belari TaxID=2138241 RepID=A0AAF3E9V6_9BILA